MGRTHRSLEEASFLRRLREKDASLWSNDPAVQTRIRDRLGWLTAHETLAARVDELTDFAETVRERGHERAVLLGMGGSSLAPEVLQRTFGAAPGYPELVVLDTTDPASILDVERSLDLEKTVFIVSSKSGTTIETASLHRYFAAKVRSRNGDGVLDSFAAITDPGTPLARASAEEGFLRCFENPPDIGGRFSALSFFGLVPAAIIGLDVARLLERAQALDPAEGVALGVTLAENALAGRDKVTFLAPPELAGFDAWAEQLLAESTGKDGKGLVPVAGEPAGPPSVYGNDRVFVRLKLHGRADGLDEFARALAGAGHPAVTIELGDAYDLGAEFLRWEIATAAAGAILGVNPFDEPNVRESKDNTTAVLREYLRAGRLPEPAPAGGEDGAAVAAHFRAGSPGDYAAIMAYIQRCPEHDALLTRLRAAVRDTTRLATTAGYGPRYLHSTGQLHKGGPDTGVFLQLTADDTHDLPIPGEPYGFSTLKRAQAIGDLRALESRGRRIMRVHLGADATAGLRKLVSDAEAALGTTAERS